MLSSEQQQHQDILVVDNHQHERLIQEEEIIGDGEGDWIDVKEDKEASSVNNNTNHETENEACEEIPEDALCRICKQPHTESDPLFHPCKVSSNYRLIDTIIY